MTKFRIKRINGLDDLTVHADDWHTGAGFVCFTRGELPTSTVLAVTIGEVRLIELVEERGVTHEDA